MVPDALGLEVFYPSSFAVWYRPTFREYVNLIPSSLDSLSNNLFCSSPTVKWCGVYPVHADVNCCLDGFDSSLLVLWSPVDFPLRGRSDWCGADTDFSDS